jgi:hypothetical protein
MADTPNSTQIKSSFQDFEAFSEAIQGWGLDFQQLDCGHFKADLHQIITPDILISEAHFSRNLRQRAYSGETGPPILIQSGPPVLKQTGPPFGAKRRWCFCFKLSGPRWSRFCGFFSSILLSFLFYGRYEQSGREWRQP